MTDKELREAVEYYRKLAVEKREQDDWRAALTYQDEQFLKLMYISSK